jgi:hypothetical protein
MISNKKLREYIADEKAGIREYKKQGWFGLAKAEQRHLNFLKLLEAKKK